VMTCGQLRGRVSGRLSAAGEDNLYSWVDGRVVPCELISTPRVFQESDCTAGKDLSAGIPAEQLG
jgi:hypothetical protein